MAPRTRATAASAPALAPLAAAPRRRVKVTSLEKEKPVEEPKQTVRATRSAKPAVEDQKTTNPATRITAAKTRGRPKKTEVASGEIEAETSAERLAEKPKRATRSTRATANTASSVAKVKPATGTTRATKTSAAKIETAPEPESQPESVPVSKPATRKKVTFQDNTEDDKENQHITRATKKTTAPKATKAVSKVSGMRAKPVRNPAATSTRATKRSKPEDEDETLEEEKPKKIQRVLTPKKITQVAKAKIQHEEDDESEDELNGGKTPVRDLTMSPRRPQSSITVEAIAKQLSPAKKLDLTQPLFYMSTKKSRDLESGPLMSPARRPPVSPAKLFTKSTTFSAKKPEADSCHGIASPARRPLDSPAKLLFPNATKNEQRAQLSQNSNLLFQSPKRSALLDPAQMFAQSAVKPQKTSLSKSNFFSSPAKRVCIFSPQKGNAIHEHEDEDTSSVELSSEIGLDEMEVTELIAHGSVEINVSSHQRPSASPVRTYKLTYDELQMDFDESILPVRSPLKVAKSPVKVFSAQKGISEPKISDFIDDDEITAGFSSLQNTPHQTLSTPKDFISLPNVQHAQHDAEEDVDMTESEDEDQTIVLPQEAEAISRPAPSLQTNVVRSIGDFAPSLQVDVIAEYLQTPKTPATVYDHDMTDLLTSPNACGTPLAVPTTQYDTETALQKSTQSTRSVHSVSEMAEAHSSVQEVGSSSPAALHENELTIAGDSVAIEEDEVCLNEGELTMIGGTPKLAMISLRQGAPTPASPAALDENELTVMGAAFTPRSTRLESVENDCEATQDVVDEQPASSPASLAEHELTQIASSSSKGNCIVEPEDTPVSKPKLLSATPDLPIPRKFSLHTVISKVPLKPEGEESPYKFQLKKRKRPVSLGGQPSQIDFTASTTPLKTSRTTETDDAASRRSSIVATPTVNTSRNTPASKISTAKSSRRAVSTPLSRSVLTPSKDSSVLVGAVVYVDVRTSEGADASAIYVDLLSSLGAKIVKEWKDGITHVVYKDGNTKILEKATLANSKIVGVSWPLDCEAQQTWVDEAEYLVTLNPVDHLLGSAARSGRRKSMEPSLLVADGSGSVKRSRSKARASTARRSTIKSLNFDQTSGSSSPAGEVSTPKADTVKQQAALEKNSLTAAWKSINATSNLGEDTPARRTLELLQKSYEFENSWDDTVVSEENDNDENTSHCDLSSRRADDTEDVEDSIIDTGLTPAPFRTKQQIGSAPSKLHNARLSSYRERVEEMERREMRNNAFGTNKGERGLVKGQKARGKRMTMFGFEGLGN